MDGGRGRNPSGKFRLLNLQHKTPFSILSDTAQVNLEGFTEVKIYLNAIKIDIR